MPWRQLKMRIFSQTTMISYARQRGLGTVDTGDWKSIAGWIAALVSGLVAAFLGMVDKFRKSRFMALESRVTMSEADIRELQERDAEKSAQISSFLTHVEYIRSDNTDMKDSIRRLHDKVDRIGRTVNGKS